MTFPIPLDGITDLNHDIPYPGDESIEINHYIPYPRDRSIDALWSGRSLLLAWRRHSVVDVGCAASRRLPFAAFTRLPRCVCKWEQNNDGQTLMYILNYVTDAMPVSFDQNCLHLTFQPYLSSESYYKKLPITNMLKYYRRNYFFLMWPANSVCLCFDPLRWNIQKARLQSIPKNVSVVQKLRTRLRCKSSWVRFPALARIFMFYFFVLLLLCFNLFVQNTLFVVKVSSPFAMLIHSVDFTFKIRHRSLGYQDTDIASYRYSIFNTGQ